MRSGRILLYLILTALLARVFYLGQVAQLPFFQDPVGDSALYLQRAREILQGDLVGDRPFFYGGILYPYLIALGLKLAPGGLYAICLAQALAGCGLGWALARLTCAASAPAAPTGWLGPTAAAMGLFYGPFAFFEADILMISWTLLAVTAAGVLLLSALACSGWRSHLRCSAAGLLVGLAASERPNLAALLPALAVWAAACAPRGGRAKGAAALLAGGAVVLLAVAGLNRVASGKGVLLTTSGGINFAIGNHEGASGTFDEPWTQRSHFSARNTDLEHSSLIVARQMSGRELDPVDASRFWFARGLAYLRDQPGEAARLYARKLALLWNAQEIPNHLNFTFIRSVAPALWLMPLGFGWVAPLGLYGFASAGSRRLVSAPALALLAILAVVPMVTVLPFFVADRYRAAAVPALIVMAAYGLADLVAMLRDPLRRRGGSIRALCLALIAFAMAQPMTSFDTSRDEWLLAQAYKKRGDVHSAVVHYRRAVAISPGDAVLRNNLGVALAQEGDVIGAEAEYREAVAIDPTLAFPQKNLGLLLARSGRGEEAFQHLLVAEVEEADDLELLRALAALSAARGDWDGASRRARRILQAAPEDAVALGVLQAAERDGP